MDLETILHQHSNQMLVSQLLEHRLKIDSAALMETVMDGQMMVISTLLTLCNGQILMVTVMETITTMISTAHNFT
jgi:hypothetical protein